MSQGKNKAADLTTFGGRLRYARELRGIKNTDLAKAAGIRQAKISQWERNRWSANRAAAPKLAKALNVSLEWLVLGCGETPKEAQAREAAYDLHQDEIDSLLGFEDADKSATFGGRLSLARENARVSQEKIGSLFGISRSAVSQWETNLTTPDLTRAAEVARLLNVRAEWLSFGSGEMTDEPDHIGLMRGEVKISVAKRLREIRKASGLSMKEWAHEMGFSHFSGWQRYEDEGRCEKHPRLPVGIAEKVWNVITKSGKPVATRSEIMGFTGAGALEQLMHSPAPWEQISRKDIRAVADQLQELVVRLRILCAE